MATKIEVLDKIMGSGKSTAVLNWCESQPEKSFLYVTPLLSESEGRVADACSDSKFTAPTTDNHKTKGEHLLDLLQSGSNASITHEMYGSLKQEHLDWIKETFGEENLVSAVLHMDEKTPHLHATIVPIVTGERRKAKKDSNPLIYKKKNSNANRLCADDIMARNKLKHYLLFP